MLKLRDLRVLMERYVPAESRHPNSLMASELWWPAHELGHLLIAAPEEIGEFMFGLDDDEDTTRNYRLECELAAMNVSAKLLAACGRYDLAEREFNDTDCSTLAHDDHGAVQRLLRERGCLRIPRTRDGLKRKLRAKVGC